MNRATLFATAIGVPAVLGIVLAVTAPAPYLVDAKPVPLDVAEPADTVITKTPDLSPFYDVDVAKLTTTTRGSLIKAEAVNGAPSGIHAYRVMYTSEDLQGNPIPVSGLFLAPDQTPPAGGFPIIAYTHGTTGVARMCGMSQTPFEANTPGFSHFDRFLRQAVEQGWAVVATDYSGMGAPGPASYLVGPLEARNALDAVRAVLNADDQTGSIQINADKVGIYGSSQGGSAAMSTLSLAPSYAPELDISGGIAMAPGLVAPIPGVIDVVASNPTSTAMNTFLLLIVKSFADNYPGLVNLDDVLTEEGVKRLPLLDSYCGEDLSKRLEDIPLSSMLKQPLDSGIVAALGMAMPGGEPITQPLVVTQGLKDVTIVPEFTHAQVMNSCAWGDQVLYATYSEDDHYTVVYTSRESDPKVFSWMSDRFDGLPAPSNCANQAR